MTTGRINQVTILIGPGVRRARVPPEGGRVVPWWAARAAARGAPEPGSTGRPRYPIAPTEFPTGPSAPPTVQRGARSGGAAWGLRVEVTARQSRPGAVTGAGRPPSVLRVKAGHRPSTHRRHPCPPAAADGTFGRFHRPPSLTPDPPSGSRKEMVLSTPEGARRPVAGPALEREGWPGRGHCSEAVGARGQQSALAQAPEPAIAPRDTGRCGARQGVHARACRRPPGRAIGHPRLERGVARPRLERGVARPRPVASWGGSYNLVASRPAARGAAHPGVRRVKEGATAHAWVPRALTHAILFFASTPDCPPHIPIDPMGAWQPAWFQGREARSPAWSSTEPGGGGSLSPVERGGKTRPWAIARAGSNAVGGTATRRGRLPGPGGGGGARGLGELHVALGKGASCKGASYAGLTPRLPCDPPGYPAIPCEPPAHPAATLRPHPATRPATLRSPATLRPCHPAATLRPPGYPATPPCDPCDPATLRDPCDPAARPPDPATPRPCDPPPATLRPRPPAPPARRPCDPPAALRPLRPCDPAPRATLRPPAATLRPLRPCDPCDPATLPPATCPATLRPARYPATPCDPATRPCHPAATLRSPASPLTPRLPCDLPGYPATRPATLRSPATLRPCHPAATLRPARLPCDPPGYPAIPCDPATLPPRGYPAIPCEPPAHPAATLRPARLPCDPPGYPAIPCDPATLPPRGYPATCPATLRPPPATLRPLPRYPATPRPCDPATLPRGPPCDPPATPAPPRLPCDPRPPRPLRPARGYPATCPLPCDRLPCDPLRPCDPATPRLPCDPQRAPRSPRGYPATCPATLRPARLPCDPPGYPAIPCDPATPATLRPCHPAATLRCPPGEGQLPLPALGPKKKSPNAEKSMTEAATRTIELPSDPNRPRARPAPRPRRRTGGGGLAPGLCAVLAGAAWPRASAPYWRGRPGPGPLRVASTASARQEADRAAQTPLVSLSYCRTLPRAVISTRLDPL
ncbi:hypothetical protein L3040_008819 [Drepanopeziza brunnea f. sp. 'multigermtubi']|nr:hypothetical protein L3040_008819 [Drepanopeziza brunnea f. sp. 'multigermtubi']